VEIKENQQAPWGLCWKKVILFISWVVADVVQLKDL